MAGTEKQKSSSAKETMEGNVLAIWYMSSICDLNVYIGTVICNLFLLISSLQNNKTKCQENSYRGIFTIVWIRTHLVSKYKRNTCSFQIKYPLCRAFNFTVDFVLINTCIHTIKNMSCYCFFLVYFPLTSTSKVYPRLAGFRRFKRFSSDLPI